MRTHSIQGQLKLKGSSCYLHHQEGLEHIFHTARKLSTDYSSERQPNCETRRGQCEKWTSSGGDHISIKTITSEYRCGTFTSRWSFCSHIICRAPTTRNLRASTNINKKQKTTRQDRFGESIPTNLLKKEEGCDGFKETSRNLEVFFIKVSKNERRTYLTNFIAVSISIGHKTKLNSNFVLALSLSYWPINHMSEANSPTNRNLILTSTDFQLMNSIVPKPYMILMKCWWK